MKARHLCAHQSIVSILHSTCDQLIQIRPADLPQERCARRRYHSYTHAGQHTFGSLGCRAINDTTRRTCMPFLEEFLVYVCRHQKMPRMQVSSSPMGNQRLTMPRQTWCLRSQIYPHHKTQPGYTIRVETPRQTQDGNLN